MLVERHAVRVGARRGRGASDMPTYLSPGVYVEETEAGTRPPTDVAALVVGGSPVSAPESGPAPVRVAPADPPRVVQRAPVRGLTGARALVPQLTSPAPIEPARTGRRTGSRPVRVQRPTWAPRAAPRPGRARPCSSTATAFPLQQATLRRRQGAPAPFCSGHSQLGNRPRRLPGPPCDARPPALPAPPTRPRPTPRPGQRSRPGPTTRLPQPIPHRRLGRCSGRVRVGSRSGPCARTRRRPTL